MAQDKRDVQLRVSAVDVNSKKTFKEVASAIDDVTSSLDDQLAAAKRGQASTADLTKTLTALKKANDDLLKQQAVVDLYRSLAEQQTRASVKVRETTEAVAAQRAQLEAIEKPTRAQVRELKSMERAEIAAAKTLMNTTRDLAEQEDALRSLGLQYDDIEAAQRQLGNAAKDVGAFYKATEAALDSYSATLAQVTNAQKKLAAEEAFQQQIQGARELRQSADYIRFWTDAIDDMAAKEREAAEVNSFRETAQKNRELIQRAEYVRDVTAALDAQEAKERQLASLNAFRQKGADAEAAVAKVQQLGAATQAAVPPTTALSDALRSILQPGQQAIKTLDGIDDKLAEVTSAIGNADQPLRAYQEAINDLGRVQNAILRSGEAIDSFRNQETAVKQAEAAYEAAEAEVRRYAAAVKAADEPNEELAQGLRQAEGALETANNKLGAQRTRLEALRVSLKGAKVDVNDLVGAENRLKAASEGAAVAVNKLNGANGGGGAGGGGGRFLGLRPYELQNLSYQINDVFTQLASGTSLTQTLAQQGGQIGQLFPQVFAVFLNPAVVAGIVAVTAVLVPLIATFKNLYDLAQSEKEFSARLAANVDGLEYNAAALAETAHQLDVFGPSLKDATAALKLFTAEGIDDAQLERFGRAAANMARIFKIDVPEAARQASEAFTGTYQDVIQLNDSVNFLTATERDYIRTLFESGEAVKARTEAFRLFEARMDAGAEKTRGPWTRAVQSLTNSWNNFITSIGNSGPIRGMIGLLGDLAEAAEKASGRLPGAQGGSAGTGSGVFTSDLDALVITALGEAGGSRTNDRERQAVISTILNRMGQTNQTAAQVVSARNQFEPITNRETLARLTAIDKNSEAYLHVQEQVLDLIRNPAKRDNFDHFYAPEAQRALSRVDGRPAVARFDNGQGTDVGRQRFFRLGYSGAPGTMGYQSPEMDRLVEERRRLREELATAPTTGTRRGTVGGAVAGAIGSTLGGALLPGVGNTLGGMLNTGEAVKSIDEINARIAEINAEIGRMTYATGALVTQNTQAQEGADNEHLESLTRELELRDRNNREARVAEARRQAIADATAADLSDEAIKRSGDLAAAAEEAVILREIRQSTVAATAELRQFEAQAQRSQTTSLESRLEAINAQVATFEDKIAQYRRQGVTQVDGTPIDQLQARVTLSAEILRQQETMKYYEEAIGELEDQRAARLLQIRDNAAAGRIDSATAFQQAAEVTSQLAPQIKTLADQGKAFAESIRGAVPDPRLEAFIAQMGQTGAITTQSGPNTALSRTGQELLSGEQQRLNAIIAERNSLVATYNDLTGVGGRTATDTVRATAEAYAASQPAIDAIVAKMRTLLDILGDPAMNALTPEALAAARANLDSFSPEAQGAEGARSQVETRERALNDIISRRNELVQNYGRLVQSGAMTSVQAQAATQAAYESSQGPINEQLAALRETLDTQLRLGQITPELYDIWVSRLQAVGSEAEYVSENFTKIQQGLESGFINAATTAFGSTASLLAGLIDGTTEWSDALGSLGDIALNFAADFLESLAQMLLQMALLQAVQSLPFFKNAAGPLSGLFDAAPLLLAAPLLTTAGGTLSAAGGALAAAAIPLGFVAASLSAAAAAMSAAASLQLAANAVGGGLFHSGGVIGNMPATMRRSVSPAAFIGAPRYHNGTVVGLKPDEQAAILQKGEEVLKKSDPRNIMNGGAGVGGGAGGGWPEMPAPVVNNYLDSGEFMEAGLRTKRGRAAFMNMIDSNKRTINEKLGG